MFYCRENEFRKINKRGCIWERGAWRICTEDLFSGLLPGTFSEIRKALAMFPKVK